MIAGVAKALAASAKTMMEPDRMPGTICGSTTRRITVSGPAPSDSAAFSTCGSSRWSEAQTDSTMKGTSTWVSAMMTPVSVYMNSIGVEISPTAIRPWLTRPVETNSSAQPSVRDTTEISSGPSTISRQSPRHGDFIRRRM